MHPHQPAPVVKKTPPQQIQLWRPLYKVTRDDMWPVSNLTNDQTLQFLTGVEEDDHVYTAANLSSMNAKNTALAGWPMQELTALSRNTSWLIQCSWCFAKKQSIKVSDDFAIVSKHSYNISRVPSQNGVSQAWHTVKIHHSGREPSISYSSKLQQPVIVQAVNIHLP